MNEKNLTVKDIARLAGTSVATVSRVINKNGRFSKETERKVLEVIEKYGYVINQQARGLRAQRSNTVGILVPNISNDFYSRITKETQVTLSEMGYMSLICNTEEKYDEAEKYLQMFRRQNADGIIYIGNNEITQLTDMPIVYVDRDPRDQEESPGDFCMVECDNIQGGRLAGETLARAGVRYPAYVCFEIGISTHRKRLLGFKEALFSEGIFFDDKRVVVTSDAGMHAGEEAVKRILATMPEVDGVFFGSDFIAVGALHYMRKTGINVPEQIKLVGFDDLLISELMGLTTIRQPMAQMGRLAAVKVIDMIENREIEVKRQRLPVELVERDTT